jgi:hypothetical protein
MTSGPNHDENPDTEGSTVPPYDGRRQSADVAPAEDATKQGARVGGATTPVEDPDMKAADPSDTEGGRDASPADEQPGRESSATDLDPDMTGPAHVAGTPRGEDQS